MQYSSLEQRPFSPFPAKLCYGHKEILESPPVKPLYKTVLVLYLLALIWLVLFKLSFEFSSVLLDHQTRSLNLIPFAGFSQTNLTETMYNLVVFIPFGLLLGVNFKRSNLWRKLAFIFMFSLTSEIVQYILAIGTTDITDILTNTFGGLLGLLLYDASKKYVDSEKLDRWIVVAGVILLVVFLLFRFLVLRVRY